MPLKIEIPDDNIEYLSPAAREEVKSSALKYADDLIKEAGRLEADIRTDNSGDPEITRQIILDAIIHKNNRYIRPKKSKKVTSIQIVSALTVTGSSNLLTYWAVTPTNKTLIIIFVIILIVAIISTILSIIWRDK